MNLGTRGIFSRVTGSTRKLQNTFVFRICSVLNLWCLVLYFLSTNLSPKKYLMPSTRKPILWYPVPIRATYTTYFLVRISSTIRRSFDKDTIDTFIQNAFFHFSWNKWINRTPISDHSRPWSPTTTT